MTKKAILLALGLGLGALPTLLSAKSLDDVYLATYAGRSDIPVPTSIVRPVVSEEFVGTDVEFVFMIDARGRPGRIYCSSPIPYELERPLVKAVQTWKFAPLRDDTGQPVPAKVRLPISVVAEQAQ